MMANGRLDPPPLDDRTWQDIVDQARSLIPSFAPEWTDHNPSDLGITLVELFAWIVEGMIYRLNRVPDRNYIEFLNLIGVTLDPATPATARLTYTLAPTLPPTPVPRGSRAATQQTGDEPALVFETDQDATILPTSLTHALRIGAGLFGQIKYANVTRRLVAAPLENLDVSLPSGTDVTLALGFDQSVTQPLTLDIRLREPAPPNTFTVNGLYSAGTTEPPSWNAIPGVNDGTQRLTRNGQITLTVPATWAGQNPEDWTTVTALAASHVVDISRFWIGLRLANPTATTQRVVFEHILFNSVPATNALTIDAPEPLGTSTGERFQAFSLRNSPLFKTPASGEPYAHLVVEVREPAALGQFGPWTEWRRVDELEAGAGRVYRLDPVLAVVEFGSHDPVASPQGHGSIPPVGSEVRARTYRHVAGGANGNLPPSTITVPRSPIAGIVGVTNHGAAQGGSNQQSVEDAKRRGPESLRNRYRAVTAEDYEYLTGEATTDVVKRRALEPRLWTIFDTIPAGLAPGDPWTFGALNRAVGNVNVIVVPDAPVAVASPQPTVELLREVRDYLTARRTITVALNVTGPRYLPIQVILDVRIWRQAVSLGLVPDPALSLQVRNDLDAKVRTYLHPIHGQADKEGWEVGEHVTIAGLFDFVQPATEIGFISSIQVVAQAPLYTPAARPFVIAPAGVWVQLADYELVCSAATHTITVSTI